jgi:predicted ABC-type ATPase
VRGIIGRIVEIITAIRNALVGKGAIDPAADPNASVRSIVDAILSGEVAKREATRVFMQAEDITALAVRGEPLAPRPDEARPEPVAQAAPDEIGAVIDQGVALANESGIDVDPAVVRGVVDEIMGVDPGSQLAAREAAADAIMATPEYAAATAMDPNAGSHLRPDYGSDADRATRVYNTPDGPITGTDAAAGYLYRKAIEAVPGGVASERKLFILIGYPGAGKSSIAEALRVQRQAVHLVADDAKVILPEYDGGRGSSFVHEESADLGGEVTQMAAANGNNIIVEKLGSSDKSIGKIADTFKKLGYEIGLVHVDVDRAVAKERAARRYQKTGRGVPVEIYNELQAGQVFDTVSRKGNIDAKATVRWDEPSSGWRVEAADPALSDLTIPNRSPAAASRERGVVRLDRGAVDGEGVQALGPDQVATPDSDSPNLMFAFAGERARNADLEALARAKAMESDGKSRDDIWTATGWFKGVDGKWRWEIDDSKSELSRPPADQTIYGLLDEVFRHRGLFDAYPSMRDRVDTSLQRSDQSSYYRPFQDRSRQGMFDIQEAITARGTDSQDLRSNLLHEIQHGIQHREDNARGGNPYGFTSDQLASERARIAQQQKDRPPADGWTMIYNDMAAADMSEIDLGRSLYRRLAGEAEARTVQKRMDMTAEERRARPPWLDYDVPEDQQIVRFDSGGPMFALDGRETMYHGSPSSFGRPKARFSRSNDGLARLSPGRWSEAITAAG